MKKGVAAAAVAIGFVVTAIWSYRTDGLVAVLINGATSGELSLERIRTIVNAWGALAPVAYVALVIVEVLIAPIPGTLLYAPAGAIFGGFLGGTLSLAGNVTGASIACWIARTIGARFFQKKLASRDVARYERLVTKRGVWVILLLRVNPLTSSDLVWYAAGLAGMPVRHVTLGTLIGMAPACYAQAYLAERLFRILPEPGWWLIGLGVIYAIVVIYVLARK